MYGEPENRVTIPRFWENSVTHLPLSRNLGCMTRLHTVVLYNVYKPKLDPGRRHDGRGHLAAIFRAARAARGC